MPWPCGRSRAGIGGRPPLNGPTPAMLVIYDAAAALVAVGLPPSIGAIATATGRTTSYISRVRQQMRDWGLWPWPDARRGPRTKKARKGDGRLSIADRVAAAAKKLAGRMVPITYAALAKETGLPRQTVERAVKWLRKRGLWRWSLVAEPCHKTRSEKVKRRVPTLAEIRFRSYRVLRDAGLSADEARGRVIAKVARFGGG